MEKTHEQVLTEALGRGIQSAMRDGAGTTHAGREEAIRRWFVGWQETQDEKGRFDGTDSRQPDLVAWAELEPEVRESLELSASTFGYAALMQRHRDLDAVHLGVMSASPWCPAWEMLAALEAAADALR